MLDTVHHDGIRLVSGAFRTSPIASLLVDIHEPPLDLRRRLLSMRYALKLLESPSHPAYEHVFSPELVDLFSQGRRMAASPLCLRIREWFHLADLRTGMVLRRRNQHVEPWLLTPPSTDLTLATTIKRLSIPTELRQQALQLMSEKYGDYIHVFTDGSKSLTGTGCAYVSNIQSRRFRLPQGTSVFTAEMLAIQKSISFVEQTREDRAAIFTDSLSAVHALMSAQVSHSRLVSKTAEKLHRLHQEGRCVTIVWIPSHVGIDGNERADIAAKQAAEMPPSHDVKIPASDLIHTAKTHMLSEWQKRWSDQHLSKMKCIKPTIGSWPSSYQRCRREEVTLCRLRIGHTYDTHRYLLMRDEDPPTCNRCGDHLSVKHVLTDCARLKEERERCFKPPFTLKSIIGDPHMCDIEAIMNFMRLTGFNVIYNPSHSAPRTLAR